MKSLFTIHDSRSTAHGIFWFLLQCFTVSVTFAIVRYAIAGINIYTMTFIQSCIAFLMIMPIVLKNGIANLKTKRLKLHLIRNLFGLAGVSSIYYGITKIPLNDATAITFTGPLFTTIAAMILLKEKLRRYRLIGMIISFIGVLIIHPPSGDFNYNVFFVFGGVFLMGFVQIFIGQLNKTEPVLRILFYMVFLSMIMVGPIAAWQWKTPSIHNIAWIFLLCCIVWINLFAIIVAYRKAEINVLMPLDFSRLIFSAAIGYLIFQEHLKPETILGSVVILAGILYALHHERRELKIPEL